MRYMTTASAKLSEEWSDNSKLTIPIWRKTIKWFSFRLGLLVWSIFSRLFSLFLITCQICQRHFETTVWQFFGTCVMEQQTILNNLISGDHINICSILIKNRKPHELAKHMTRIYVWMVNSINVEYSSRGSERLVGSVTPVICCFFLIINNTAIAYANH